MRNRFVPNRVTAAALLLASVLVSALAFVSPVSAHVVNPENVYEDIGLSAAKDDIALLTGLNVIVYDHAETMYRPQDPLTRTELAQWAAVFQGLAAQDAEQKAAAQSALEHHLVASLDGNATYGDVNQAFFAGKAVLPENAAAGDELTREQYAAWMGSLLHEPYHEQGNLLERSGYAEGPSGEVEVMKSDEGHHGFLLMIDGETYALSEHPRVLNAPSDPSLWSGRQLQSSWLTGGTAEGEKRLQLLIFSEPAGREMQAVESASGEPASAAGHVHETAHVPQADAAAQPASEQDGQEKTAGGFAGFWAWIVIVGIAAAGGVWIAGKGRRAKK